MKFFGSGKKQNYMAQLKKKI